MKECTSAIYIYIYIYMIGCINGLPNIDDELVYI